MTAFSFHRLPFIAPLAGLALFVSPLIAHAEGSLSKQPAITVSATGYTEATPDMAIINLAVVSYGKTAESALNANNKTSNSVLNSLKQSGIEPKDLQTSDLSIYPVNKEDKVKKQAELTYRVSNTLNVQVRDINKAGTIFDEIMGLGVNAVNGISFTNADPTPFYVEARKKAVTEAIEKAITLAQAANVKLGSIISIVEDNNGNRPVFDMERSSKPLLRSATQFSSGELTYAVNVTVTFAIDQ